MTPIPTLSDLILFRLLVAPPEGETPSNVKKDLQPFSDSGLSREELKQLFDDLTTRGFVAPQKGNRRYSLTPNGRSSAHEKFKLGDDLPAKTRWVSLRDRYLTALALGVGDDTSVLNQIAKAEVLRAAILKKYYADELRSLPTLAKVVDHVIGKAVGAQRSTPGEFRNALIKKWLFRKPASNEPEPEATPSAPLAEKPIEAFASEIQQMARQTPTGRFGDNKVFISHVWRELEAKRVRGFAADYSRFKARLMEANHKGLVALSRADLTGAFPREDAEASEISDSLSSFHFIQI
jgi:hypothetical protein